MKIRHATSEDVEEMAILWRMMIKEIQPNGEANKAWWIQYQREMMKTNLYCSFVATYQSVMVGFINGLVYPDAVTGDLIGLGQDFYVVPEFRGGKITKLLYRNLIKSGKKRGVKALEFTCFEGQLDMWMNKGYKINKYYVRRAV